MRGTLIAIAFIGTTACGRTGLEPLATGGGGGPAATGGGTPATGGGGGAGGGGGIAEGRRPVGSPCVSPDQCTFAPGDDIHQYTPECLMSNFTNGYCALPSHDGFGCWDGMGVTGQMLCLKACTANADCRQAEGYSCCGVTSMGEKLCIPGPCD